MASTMLHEKCCNTVLQIGAPLLVTPAGTSNELDVRNKWEENTHNTHTCQKKNVCLKKNQNAPRSSGHPPVRGGGMSKRLGGIKGCKYKTSSWHLNGFLDENNIGSTV